MESKAKAHLLRASLVLVAACTSGAERFGDFNGDGVADVLLRHSEGSWRYHAGDGDSEAPGEPPLRITTNLAWYWAGAGDFNGDGRDDVMLRRDDGAWVYYPLDGRRVIVDERGWANVTRNLDFRVVGVGDFNADGRDDILMRRTDGAWAYYPMNGRRVIRAEAGWASLPRNPDWRFAGIGDFDGDGRDAVLLRHVAAGTWRYYAMNGRRVVAGQSRTTRVPRDQRWRIAGIGDFDGDGRDDVLLRHTSGRWRYHDIASATATNVDLDPDRPWRLAGIGDVDGDGRDDMLLRHDDGEWRWHHVDGRRASPDLPEQTDWAIPTRPVYVPDRALRRVLEGDLAKGPNALIRPRELLALTRIRAQDAGISDLTGLGAATALDEVILAENEISLLWPLAGLSNLRHLSVTENRVRDLSPLAHLPRIDILDLAVNEIDDVSPLAGLTTLRYLSLDENDVEDLSPLRSLTRMQLLYLSNNRIEDVAPLAGMTALAQLLIVHNRVEDVSPLSSLENLQTLILDHNNVRDLTPFKDFPALTSLSLNGNHIDDISPLADLNRLTLLRLAHNQIEDLRPLARHTALEDLDLSHNRITDLSGLKDMALLVSLRVAHNRVEDVSALAGLTGLRDLDLSYNLVVDIAALENLAELESLGLAHNKITNLQPLVNNAGLGDGDRIDLRGNPLGDESYETLVSTLIARGAHVDITTRAGFEIGHGGSVVVLRVDEDIARLNLFTGLPLDEYATTLYSYFEDVFDFIMFFSNLDDIDDHENPRYFGVYSPVRNDIAGVGRSMFYSNDYGSAETLKGAIHFPYNRALRSGPSLHEILHAWANYTIPTAVDAHWGFSSANGQLGGFDIGNFVELGDNRYAAGRFGTYANGGNRPAYSPIELYFAGYIPPEEVPDLWVAADGEWIVEDGDLVRTQDGHGVFSATDVRTYAIEDIVEQNGPRVPGMADAQWHFRVAVVLLTDDDHPATDRQLDLLGDHAAWFSRAAPDETYLHNFFEATGGRGTVTMDGLSQFRKPVPSAATGLPASYGVVPEPRVTLLDGRCLPLSAARLAGGSELRRDVGADGRHFTGDR